MADIRNAVEDVLQMLKGRRGRLNSATAQDEYLRMRILAAADQMESIGMPLHDNPEDKIFLADYVDWEYSNRDKPGGMPDWLRLRRRERWLKAQTEKEAENDT